MYTDWNKKTQYHALNNTWESYGTDVFDYYGEWFTNNDWYNHQSGVDCVKATGEGYHDGTGVTYLY